MQQHTWSACAVQLMPAQLKELGNTLIVAPHPDDESLGCGGTIHLLTQLGVPVHVLFISDGSMSHPNSKKYPSDKRVLLREMESRKALQILGVGPDQITFLRIKDGQVPFSFMADFDKAVNSLLGVFCHFLPQTVFVPWQRDPHPDHRASWQLVRQALMRLNQPMRIFEYFIWLWERAAPTDLPQPGECKAWKVDIKRAAICKQKAIRAHVSQTTTLIDDDPQGFTLSADVLAHFNKPYELFVEKA